MGQKSKRTRAPAPLKVPPSAPHLILPAAPHLVFPPVPQPAPLPPLHPDQSVAFPSTYGDSWIPQRPPQSVAASSAPCWGVASSLAQGPCWEPPAGIGGSAYPWYTPENIDDSQSDGPSWGLDSHPPGGFLSFFKNTPSHAQAVGNGTSTQPINVGDDTNGGDCARTEKCLLWTKEEDLRLVSAWLNNSNDPIQLQEERTILE